ncbi:hypothetical protein LIP_2204 [Limnochorda pilosa]|uniref:Uncharacterized protein n=1 Tax=Limnochorda pilosa TaxID=1555112 RepID=A0A0K2SLR4_LIMPI|nr:hypothetical protein LIP_2204 [Limnochorda pilosa]
MVITKSTTTAGSTQGAAWRQFDRTWFPFTALVSKEFSFGPVERYRGAGRPSPAPRRSSIEPCIPASIRGCKAFPAYRRRRSP